MDCGSSISIPEVCPQRPALHQNIPHHSPISAGLLLHGPPALPTSPPTIPSPGTLPSHRCTCPPPSLDYQGHPPSLKDQQKTTTLIHRQRTQKRPQRHRDESAKQSRKASSKYHFVHTSFPALQIPHQVETSLQPLHSLLPRVELLLPLGPGIKQQISRRLPDSAGSLAVATCYLLLLHSRESVAPAAPGLTAHCSRIGGCCVF